MKKIFVMLLVAAASLAVNSSTARAQNGNPMVGGAAMYSNKDIVDNAVNSADHTTLVAAVKAAGLVETLKGKGPFTVFAPTNAAFATLIGALGEATVLSCDVLPTVLAFHVTRGRHTSTSVLARQSIRMINGEWAAVEGTTIAGAPLNLGLVNISASNGIVHVVDAVLLPPSILAALQ